MYYIFNKHGKCLSKTDYTPNEEDLGSRDEVCVESEVTLDIGSIKFENGKIVEFSDKGVTLGNLPLKEHQWVKSEIEKSNVELMYHWTKDLKRQSYSEKVWGDYIISLRNYTTVSENGDIKVTSEVRPVVEDFIPKVDDQPDNLVEVEDGKVTGTDIIIYEELNPLKEEV